MLVCLRTESSVPVSTFTLSGAVDVTMQLLRG
jgi:hypothetical protein